MIYHKLHQHMLFVIMGPIFTGPQNGQILQTQIILLIQNTMLSMEISSMLSISQTRRLQHTTLMPQICTQGFKAIPETGISPILGVIISATIQYKT